MCVFTVSHDGEKLRNDPEVERTMNNIRSFFRVYGLSRKIWSGEKNRSGRTNFGVLSGPAGPKMTPKLVRLIQNWSVHINTLNTGDNPNLKWLIQVKREMPIVGT